MNDSIEEFDKKDDIGNDDQNTDIDFVYSDTDEYSVEIAEESEFDLNRAYFEEEFNKHSLVKWFEASNSERLAHVQRILDYLDSANKLVRQKSARSLLYLLQGNFGDCDLEEDQIIWARHNVYICIEAGVLRVIINLLLYEIEYESWNSTSSSVQPSSGTKNKENENSDSSSNSHHESTLMSSMNLRVLLSILYIMVETVRDAMFTDENQKLTKAKNKYSSSQKLDDMSNNGDASTHVTATNNSNNNGLLAKLREQFVEELGLPIFKGEETTLAVILFGMIYRFSGGLAPHFPMKKVLLLLWKVLLITLGPLSTYFRDKNEMRRSYGLPFLSEDSTEVIRRVRANSPPATSCDQILSRFPRNNNRHLLFGQSNQAPRQGSLAGSRLAFQQLQQQSNGISSNATSNSFLLTTNSITEADSEPPGSAVPGLVGGFDTPRPSSPISDSATPVTTPNQNNDNLSSLSTSSILMQSTTSDQSVMIPGLMHFFLGSKALPWKPKVKEKDLEAFLTSVRLKFIGFDVPNDTVSLAGLPEPIHEAVRVMREHLYVSLSEKQIEAENKTFQNPFSMSNEQIPDTPAERLYRAMYPSLPQYVIALLKILLVAGPPSLTKTDSINILAEITPKDWPCNINEVSILNFDINRHREIIVKAISALLLLLLKRMKLNHVYQFEYISQYLLCANCILLILKFFNQNISSYVQAKNTLSCFEFPARRIGEPTDITTEMTMGDWSSYCWRNLFACINLLRIVNMLTKGKSSLIMLLVAFKSAAILKRSLRIRHAMLQLYILKLLKMQSRYCGRQWRKNNMSIMSAIYQKVRHRLTDDWAFGNDVDASTWQFELEECSLRTSVEQFNQRRYNEPWINPEFKPIDNCLMSALNQPCQLSAEFKQNYEKWLEEEVFCAPINWSQILSR